jgi:hypothetical protein
MRRKGRESLREEKTPIVFIGLGGWCFARIMNRLFEVRYHSWVFPTKDEMFYDSPGSG